MTNLANFLERLSQKPGSTLTKLTEAFSKAQASPWARHLGPATAIVVPLIIGAVIGKVSDAWKDVAKEAFLSVGLFFCPDSDKSLWIQLFNAVWELAFTIIAIGAGALVGTLVGFLCNDPRLAVVGGVAGGIGYLGYKIFK